MVFQTLLASTDYSDLGVWTGSDGYSVSQEFVNYFPFSTTFNALLPANRLIVALLCNH